MNESQFFDALFQVKNTDKAFCKQIKAFNYTLNNDDLELVNKTLELRNFINYQHKNFDTIKKYERNVDINELNIKGLKGEIALNKVLYNLFKNNSSYSLKCPALVQFNVDKEDFDFTVSNLNYSINFELKTQDINIKYTNKYLCLNQNSFERQHKNKDNNLYIACILNDNKCYYFMFNKNYFEQNKKIGIAKSGDNYFYLEINDWIKSIVE